MRSRRIVDPFSNPRRAALSRAGIAVAAAIILLLIALWFEDRGEPAKKPAARAPEAPTASNATLDRHTALSVDALVDQAVENIALQERDNATPAPTPASDQPAPANPASAIQSRDATEPPAKPASPPREAFKPLPGRYFVQLGVFYDMENAEKLRSNAKALGLPAHLQARVVVGPFSDKREAEAARRRLRSIAKGVVVPPQKAEQAKEQPRKQRRRSK